MRDAKCKILVYFMTIWSILRPSEIFYGHLVYCKVIRYIFPQFDILYLEKSGNPVSTNRSIAEHMPSFVSLCCRLHDWIGPIIISVGFRNRNSEIEKFQASLKSRRILLFILLSPSLPGRPDWAIWRFFWQCLLSSLTRSTKERTRQPPTPNLETNAKCNTL
jgi:hypothetical protein